ncbi:hypothetical protein SERLADRAFT_439938 [Serpula lacrymans var. lacrymans S7.9]|uniref:TPR-like protein n=1 Tax=Serpula lacrymans var. lacrymans (strain S7.9) TaxID=578457 RepID=F8P214_SERL9|nr:uncharacterized protein SERLADRAFT_439938 [Serpula lacrymans var. lacrymans S7.9]EGO23192.1 hypothetical protein SERLADRAFT_439938 [Serpula lacrymans var. lacrymans S7.9]
MAHAKDKHYWFQLRATLTAGQWSAQYPAKAPNGTALSWSELLRKFKKHCKGFTEVAEVASQTQALALLLGANSTDEDQLGDEHSILVLGNDCILPEERIEEASAAYESLQKLNSTNFDSLHIALAYYSYALGRPADCLSHLAKVSNIPDAQSHIPSAPTTRSDISALQVPGSQAESSSSWTSSLVSSDSCTSIADIKDGRAWAMTESVRSICLQGMSLEKISSDPQKVLDVYATALPLLDIIEYETPRTLTASPSPTSFTNYRELWRWVERLIYRAITLASRTCSLDEELLWSLFKHYHSCSVHWPATYRTEHRSVIAVLHLRALILRNRSSPSISSPHSPLPSDKPPQWLGTARSVIKEYQTILSSSTYFPKAGQHNVRVEDFVDLCVAVWETSGALDDRARWVLDILWWATRLTFNSYRIFRHMTRLLYVSGDSELAKRTLRLYVQVVGKSREAGFDEDADTDRHWVETLIEGSRMLCRLSLSRNDYRGAEEATEAGEMIEKAKVRLDKDDKELCSRVDLAEGIWESVMAITAQDPHTRPARLTQALSHFVKSIGTFPTPSAYHHLALALARPGPSQDLDQAITCARSAVEGEPREIRHWHLLGLLLTADEQWDKAKGVLEVGAGIGENESAVDHSEGDTVGDVKEEKNQHGEGSGLNGVQTREVDAEKLEGEVDNGHADSQLQNGNGHVPETLGGQVYLLSEGSTTVPPAATLLQPLPDRPHPSKSEAYKHALQLRMTQMTLAEHMEGPEGAEMRWVDVFSWVAERKGTTEPQPRSSMDTVAQSTNTRALSESSHSRAGEVIAEPKTPTTSNSRPDGQSSLGLTLSNTPQALSEKAPPIMITPATPAEPNSQFHLATDPLNEKRSLSIDRDTSAGKKVQQMFKNRVHKGQARITTISKKIGNGMVRNPSARLRPTGSAPDFHSVLQNHHYQASSIHSRRRLGSFTHPHHYNDSPIDSPPPPPPPTLPPAQESKTKKVTRATGEDTLLSDLWAMSAATFRRLGKIEQAKGAIQEAEVKDQNNPAVWVQLGVYYHALCHDRQAIEAFRRLCSSLPTTSLLPYIYAAFILSAASSKSNQKSGADVDMDKVDLVAGMLAYVTRAVGWDVPEAWYFLAKAYGLQGRKDRERECLTFALTLSERRSVRDIGLAVGWCL